MSRYVTLHRAAVLLTWVAPFSTESPYWGVGLTHKDRFVYAEGLPSHYSKDAPFTGWWCLVVLPASLVFITVLRWLIVNRNNRSLPPGPVPLSLLDFRANSRPGSGRDQLSACCRGLIEQAFLDLL
jgi:hypothetical protein